MQYDTSYMDTLFLDEFNQIMQVENCCEKQLEVRKLKNAIVLPFISDQFNHSKGRGGVVNGDGKYIEISSMPQEAIMEKGYELEREPEEKVTGVAIYLGYFIKQWGHFIVDFLPRFWWIMEHYNSEPIVVLTNSHKIRIDGNYLEMLQLFGITEDKIMYCYKATRFEQLIIPELSLRRPQFYSKEAKKLYDEIVVRACSDFSIKKYDKIYFTRRKLKKAILTEQGERDVEKLFKMNGYKVIAPEKCTLRELIFYIHNCKEFVSLSGTIPHNIVFARKETRCVIINKTYRINTIQLLLNNLADCNVVYIDAHISLLPVSPGSGPFMIAVNDNMIKFAKDRNFRIKKVYIKSGRIAKYLQALKKEKMIKNYFVQYCRLQDEKMDIGGSIEGHARPECGYEDKRIYFYYRKLLGEVTSNTNLISFITNMYHYIREGKM